MKVLYLGNARTSVNIGFHCEYDLSQGDETAQSCKEFKLFHPQQPSTEAPHKKRVKPMRYSHHDPQTSRDKKVP
jgi:hypothetical protein